MNGVVEASTWLMLCGSCTEAGGREGGGASLRCCFVSPSARAEATASVWLGCWGMTGVEAAVGALIAGGAGTMDGWGGGAAGLGASRAAGWSTTPSTGSCPAHRPKRGLGTFQQGLCLCPCLGAVHVLI